MAKLQFDKYQALGNDFVLFDQCHHPAIPEPDADTIKRICNRRFGIGADGILLFRIAMEDHNSDPHKKVRMIYFNSDGGRAETCFNGVRCIALHAVLNDQALRNSAFEVITDTGSSEVKVSEDLDQVSMTLPQAPEFEPSRVPVRRSSSLINDRIEIDDLILTGTALSIGNPHFVTWTDENNLEKLNDDVLKMGAKVENASLFPHGTNFEIAYLVDDKTVLMAVWERGVGRTLACGSGATATVCAGIAAGKIKAGHPVRVIMAGGTLDITVSSDFSEADQNTIIITGAAKHVFSGYIDEKVLLSQTSTTAD